MSNAADGTNPVIGPTGAPMTLDDLPPSTLKRWITRRKAEVVAAVRGGLIGFNEACARYGISAEEFLSWERLLDDHGLQGLRATRLQDYRNPGAGGVEDGAGPVAATEE